MSVTGISLVSWRETNCLSVFPLVHVSLPRFPSSLFHSRPTREQYFICWNPFSHLWHDYDWNTLDEKLKLVMITIPEEGDLNPVSGPQELEICKIYYDCETLLLKYIRLYLYHIPKRIRVPWIRLLLRIARMTNVHGRASTDTYTELHK